MSDEVESGADLYNALFRREMDTFTLRVDTPVTWVVNECMKAARRAFLKYEEALAAEGYSVGQWEQVGTQDSDGFLHEMRQGRDGQPVFRRVDTEVDTDDDVVDAEVGT